MDEHLVNVRTNFVVGRHQAEVGVEPGSTRMVIAGSQVNIASKYGPLPFFLFTPHDQRHFGVGLVADHAVHDMCADLLKSCRPVQIRFLVESRHQFYHDSHFLANRGGVDQRFHNDRIGPGTIYRQLDCHHLRILRRLLNELDDGRKTLKRMVQQDILFLQHAEKIFPLCQFRYTFGLAGYKYEKFEVRPRHLVGYVHQPHQIYRAIDAIDIDLVQLELCGQKLQRFLGAVVGNFQPDGIAKMALR